MNNLVYLRMKRRLSQRDLAKMIGIHATSLNRIERGWLAHPPSGFVEKCQTIFGRGWTWEQLMAEPPELAPMGCGGRAC